MGSFVECLARRLNDPAVRRPSGGSDWSSAVAPAHRWLEDNPEPRLLVADPDPLQVAARTAVALIAGRDVFLGNPQWTHPERAAADALVRAGPSGQSAGGGRLLIATGGSSGGLRFAIHTSATLVAAAAAFCTHFGFTAVNGLCLLPLHHISGFQQLVRSLVSGGTLQLGDWQSLAAGERPELETGAWVVSLVPAQLQRLLAQTDAAAWLRGFAAIFLGGAPANPALLDRARAAGLAVASAYGATETAAQCAAQTPAEFAAGAAGLRLLPHATARILDVDTGVPLPADRLGRIEVAATSLFHGYWPDVRLPGPWATDDLGCLDVHGRLHVLGRSDLAINTGGEKVHPAEVEAALRATGAFSEVVVLGLPDPDWGECVAAFFPASDAPALASLGTALRARLSAAKIPRRWFPIANWPHTAAGKVDRAALRHQALQ